MPTVYVKTLGCKVNSFDSHALEHQFRSQGYDVSNIQAGADVTVVNTCSVTANADKEARYLARRLRRDNPETMLVFTGCYAQTDSAALAAMDEIDLVIPNEIKHQLVDFVEQGRSGKQDKNTDKTTDESRADTDKIPAGLKAVSANRQTHFKSSATLFDRADSEQTRAFLKVQDGCDGFCTYCLIPYARGASRSVARDLVLREIQRLVDTACPEIVLTGIHIGDYGEDLPEYAQHAHPFVGLLEDIFQIKGVRRLRISSLEPRELTPALVSILAQHREAICDHMHLPLQSGNDRILKLMRRSYDKATYADAVRRFRHAFPEACIGADVIPGFPGETEAEFRETLEFIEELDLAYLHVFPYSARPNTAAMRLPEHLDASVVKARAAVLRQLSERLWTNYMRRFIGKSLPVLWEKELDEQGRRLGRTPNYLAVVAGAPAAPASGEISLAQVKGFVEQNRLLVRC